MEYVLWMKKTVRQFFDSVKSLREALEADQSFSHFNLNPAPGVLDTIQHIQIGQYASYDNFGRLDVFLSETDRFLISLGNSPSLAAYMSLALNELVGQTLQAFETETAWITIRASQPTDYFDVPRWHKDGYFYPPYTGDQHKAVFVLKGPQTLMNDLHSSMRASFNELSGSFAEDSKANREKIAALIDNSLTRQAVEGQGSIFVVGSDRAAIHSEPPIYEERLFLSVAPGTTAQIEGLRTNWDSPFTTYTP